MSRRSALIILSLLLLVLVPTARAQQITAELPRDEKPITANEKKAVDLLEKISDQVTNLHSPGNRLRAECGIADLLWTRDEKRARALFKTASDELVDLIANIDFGDPEFYQQLTWISQQRSELVNRLAAHDPDAAISLLKATRVAASNDPRTKWFGDMETNLELQLAGLIARQNPARALELARATLSRGLSYNLINLVSQLQAKDPKAAMTLYKEIVEQIKHEDPSRNNEAANIAWNLLWFQPPQADEDTYRDLLATLVTSALAITPTDQNSMNMAQNIYGQLPSLMPLIEKYVPASAAPMRQWSQNVERSFDPSTRMFQEMNRIAQNGTVDDVLALAPRYPAELQVQIYQQAAWKALASGDANRARQIVTDLVSDPAQRRQMLAQIENQLVENAINQDKIADVRQMLSRVPQVERRVQTLVRLAATLASKGDKKGALELLNEVKTMVDAARPGAAQVWGQVQLAQSYASLDPDQSFTIVQALILKTNELAEAATVLDGFDAHYLKDGEWITPGPNMLGNIINSLIMTLAVLARLDFDHALAAANQIERPELRLAADLEIARAALQGKTNMNVPMFGRRISIE